jgi:ribosome recycling factor
MTPEIQSELTKADQLMQKAYAHAQAEFAKIRAGRAMPDMVEGLHVPYYNSLTPLSQVASVTAPDARTIVIKPWDKHLLQEIEKAITGSRIGLYPQNDGQVIRISIPPLTEERRKDLVKQVKHEAEKGKVAIRNIRKDSKEALKTLQKEATSEDLIKGAEEKLQTLTDKHIQQLDKLVIQKEADIMGP